MKYFCNIRVIYLATFIVFACRCRDEPKAAPCGVGRTGAKNLRPGDGGAMERPRNQRRDRVAS